MKVTQRYFLKIFIFKASVIINNRVKAREACLHTKKREKRKKGKKKKIGRVGGTVLSGKMKLPHWAHHLLSGIYLCPYLEALYWLVSTASMALYSLF